MRPSTTSNTGAGIAAGTLIVLIGLLWAGGCDASLDFARDHPFDPRHPLYSPQGPDNLRVHPVGKVVEVSWNANSATETAYVVERASSETQAFSSIATLPPRSNSYRDSITVWGSYRYRIRAIYPDRELTTEVSEEVELKNWLRAGEQGREAERLVTLTDGRVLAYGRGYAAVFEAHNYRWVNVAAPECSGDRVRAAALENGGALILGISIGAQAGPCISISDPSFSIWTRIDLPDLALRTRDRLAVLSLPDGRVLAVAHVFEAPSYVMKAFYIDPASETVYPAKHPKVVVGRHDNTPDPVLTLLANGKIFIINDGGNSYMLDSGSDRWDRWSHFMPYHSIGFAAILPDGRMLAVQSGSSGPAWSVIDLGDGRVETHWSPDVPGGFPRFVGAAADGRVYCLGGILTVFDPTAMRWEKHPAGVPAFLIAGTFLTDGRLLFIAHYGGAFVFREREG